MKTSLRHLLLVCLLHALVAQAQPYCQPVFVTPPDLVYIDGFVLGSINNAGSGFTLAPGYTNYQNSGPNSITSVAPGGTYTGTITSGYLDALREYAIWVDLDQDFIYEANELLAVASTNSGGFQTITVNITIPGDALGGYTGMRVMCKQGSPPTDPCGSYEYGEAEDYTVVIDNGAPCIPVFPYGNQFGDHMDGFQFGSINIAGSGVPDTWSYTDRRYSGADYMTTVQPGSTYIATILSGTTGGGDLYTIWVDLDGDLVFEANELLAQATTAGQGVQTTLVNVTIPANAPTGYTGMRVTCTNVDPPVDGCGADDHGETEDYTIVISDGSTCIPLYSAQASQGHFVSEVQLADMVYGPVSAAPGYVDATTMGAHLQAGGTSTLTLFGGSASSGYLSAWVDWDNNGFGAGELIGSLPVGTGFAQVNFDVTPPSDFFGYARLRVAHTDASVDACDPSAFGSAVDFTLSVAHAGWPCLPLQGNGTQFGDGFTGLEIGPGLYPAQPEFPYYAWSSVIPQHYEAGFAIVLGFYAGAYAPETYRLWMDMNDDGDFTAGELLSTNTSTVPGEVVLPSVLIPLACPPGQHFARLRANDEVNDPLTDPCDDSNYGQIFDWGVVVEDPNGPCIPHMSLWTTDGDFIDGVQLGTIQNTGTGTAFGAAYQDYTAQSATLIAGQPSTLTITGGAYAGDTYSAWIDYNNDNDFDDAGEPLGWIGIANSFGTNDLPFTVPPGTALGNKRMRVRCATAPLSNACADLDYGETEDYTVNIDVNTGIAATASADFSLLRAEDGMQLMCDAAWLGYSYTLFDATGRALTTGSIAGDRTGLPMTAFAKGSYTVVLDNDTERAVKRFIW